MERLRQVGAAPSQLQGILVTHEHSDHITGLPSLVYRYAIPAIADPRTLDALEEILTSGIYRTDSGGQLPKASIDAQSIEPYTQVPGKEIPTQPTSPAWEPV